jgi:hypothetical protein
VATVVLLLLHVPFAVASVSAVVELKQTVAAPDIGAGAAMTVIVLVTGAPQPVEKVIVGVPATPPVTTPVPAFAVATVVLLLLQVPFAVASDNVMDEPEQTVAAPDMGPGAAITVMFFVTALPQPVEKVIVAVPAIAPPVTTPEAEPTVATAELLVLQVPFAVASLNVVVKPTQTVAAPDMATGGAMTVIVVVAAEPQPVE